MTFFDELENELNGKIAKKDCHGFLVDGGTGRSGRYVSFRFPGQSMRIFVYECGKFSVSRTLDERASGEIGETAARAFFELWFEMMW